jgi:hypothetical protein
MRDEKHTDVSRLSRQNRKNKGKALDPGLRRDDEMGSGDGVENPSHPTLPLKGRAKDPAFAGMTKTKENGRHRRPSPIRISKKITRRRQP